MNRTIQTNGENYNGPENSNTTTIRRTLVEHGIRPVNNDNNHESGSSTNISAITAIVKQHQNEQLELQELNKKLSSYLGHVHDLETYNGQSLAELEDLRLKWGNNIAKIDKTYAPQLKTLRDELDNSLRDQILHELQLKQHEYDIDQTQQRIKAFDGDFSTRLKAAEQELKTSLEDLEKLKNLFERRSTDLIQDRTNLENLGNEFDGLQTELLNNRLERILIQNELQTLREDAAFHEANYQAQKAEILSLSVPSIDASKFYRNELVYAIADIRRDFEILSQTQFKEFEEYYRIKTEEIHQDIAKDNERKRLLKSENETNDFSSDLSSWGDLNDEYKELKTENNQLLLDFNDTLDDLTRIQDEHFRENEKNNIEFNQLQQELDKTKGITNEILQNNISLRFELSTYRNLLNSEEKRLNRAEEQVHTSSSSSNQNLNKKPNDYKVQRMAVKKTGQGSILFDSIDFVNDYIVIIYEKSIGDKQLLENWTVHHQNDQQPEIVYKFPSSFNLEPRQTVRILTKRSPQSVKTGHDVLIADEINSWGQGQVMITRLIDNNNQEKATITHTRVPG